MLGFGRTDVGKVRGHNEDNILVQNTPVGGLPDLYVVADGMGGHKAGEVASELAIKYCCAYLSDKNIKEGEILDTLIEAVKFANTQVYAESRSAEQYHDMGTTFVGCTIVGETAYIAHVGDSRLYKVNKNDIEQITTDHSYVEMMVKAGEITPQEAENHPDRNIITRAVGTNDTVDVDGYVLNLAKDDIILICSDGLSTMVSNEDLFNIISKDDLTLEQRVNILVESANENGGKDNISAILIDLREGDNK